MKYIKNYIFFAKEFPNLFKFIFMENPYKETVEEQKFASIIIKKISEAGGYSEDTAFKFFMQSFVFRLEFVFFPHADGRFFPLPQNKKEEVLVCHSFLLR